MISQRSQIDFLAFPILKIFLVSIPAFRFLKLSGWKEIGLHL